MLPLNKTFSFFLIFVVEILCSKSRNETTMFASLPDLESFNMTVSDFTMSSQMAAGMTSASIPDLESINTTIPYNIMSSKMVEMASQISQMKLENTQMKLENTQMKLENSQMKLENSQMKLENSQMKLENKESYVMRCAEQYRNILTYLENLFTVASFANKYPMYKSIRTEYIRDKFHQDIPEYKISNHTHPSYVKAFDIYYGNHANDNLDPYGRVFCFIVWLLGTNEWKLYNDPNGSLRVFRQALIENSPIEITHVFEISHWFAWCWVWLWNISSKGDKLPIGIAKYNPPQAEEFVKMYEGFEKDNRTNKFCGKVLHQFLEEDPYIVTATLPLDSKTVRRWYEYNESINWDVEFSRPIPFTSISFLDTTVGTKPMKPQQNNQKPKPKPQPYFPPRRQNPHHQDPRRQNPRHHQPYYQPHSQSQTRHSQSYKQMYVSNRAPRSHAYWRFQKPRHHQPYDQRDSAAPPLAPYDSEGLY